jgi:hypothetical protein
MEHMKDEPEEFGRFVGGDSPRSAKINNDFAKMTTHPCMGLVDAVSRADELELPDAGADPVLNAELAAGDGDEVGDDRDLALREWEAEPVDEEGRQCEEAIGDRRLREASVGEFVMGEKQLGGDTSVRHRGLSSRGETLRASPEYRTPLR